MSIKKRILFRDFSESDLENFHLYRSDPNVSKYQAWNPYSWDDSLNFINKQIHSKASEPGLWYSYAIA